ncbi:MAG: SH3 domain-containing protein [Dehalococcoidia bacterium]
MRAAPQWSAATPKRFPRAAWLALLIIPLVVLAAASSVRADAVATVLPSDGLYLRAAPGIQYPTMDLIPGGTRLALTDDKNDDGWYPAVYKAKRGWVKAEFLDVSGDATAMTRSATVGASAGVNLRSEPHTSAERLDGLTAGTVLTVSVQTTSDGWVMVAHAGQTGWVSAEELRFDNGPAGSPPTATSSPAPAVAGRGPVRATFTYYHHSLEGGPMACGGRYRAEDPTIAAATSWPCGTRLRVCRNANCITVTVQDTGHLGPNWVDLSAAAFRQLAPISEALVTGTVEVLPPGQ